MIPRLPAETCRALTPDGCSMFPNPYSLSFFIHIHA
jgi:hypothetical protein